MSDENPDATNSINKVGLQNLQKSLNRYVNIERYISLKDSSSFEPPEHIPKQIKDAFTEGATCFAVGCPNAAATMFRLCVDIATRSLLPKEDIEGIDRKTRRDLGLRLPWLFRSGRLPKALEELSSCIKEEGNDGAHAGSLTKVDAEDVLDFTIALLERMYTEPERLRIAKTRREKRRGKPAS